MRTVDSLMALIERLEKAMRPIGEAPDSPDHDRVRELYQHLMQDAAADPLEQARLTVLHEILAPYVPSVSSAEFQTPGALTYNAKAAIGALVVFLCHLDEGDYELATSTLQVATELLHEMIELLRAFKGDCALA